MTPPPPNPLTVEAWNAYKNATGLHLHVYVDGRDVTRRTFEADVEKGYVLVYCRDPIRHDPWATDGRTHAGLCEADVIMCQHRLVGTVTVVPGQPFY